MNKTNELVSTTALENGVVATPDDWKEALAYFQPIYSGIKYNEANDTFEYRGYNFSYFKAGVIVNTEDLSRKYGYMLVSVHEGEYHPDGFKFHNWLGSFGDNEEEWQKFVEREEAFLTEKNKPNKLGWWQRLFSYMSAIGLV